MAQPRESRVVKRSGNHNGEGGKRRAPYALRACDTCRRRKGKCDGQQPCRHCAGRGLSCGYSSTFDAENWQTSSVSTASANSDAGQTHDRQQCAQARLPSPSNRETIAQMLSALQEQLDDLASRVQTGNHGQSSSPSPALGADNSGHGDFTASLTSGIDVTPSYLSATKLDSRAAASKHFCGPTSPDYSFNVAQLKLRQSSISGPPLQRQQLQLASIDEEDNEDDEDADATDPQNVGIHNRPRFMHKGALARLLQFRSTIGLPKALQLLCVYQEVVGDLHPILDFDELLAQTRSLYADAGPAAFAEPTDAASNDSLLILNLALAIALRADSNPTHCHIESLIRASFQDSVNSTLASPASSIKHVIITLLKGWYDFFHDMPTSAWRMCGIAANMLMELGFHNGEVSKRFLDSEARRVEIYSLMSSIIILDRQWSSATGLPSHIHENTFNPVPASRIKNPYLKAMLSFVLISDRFGEPISQAAKGQRYSDHDAFEVMNFQIEQWRKKAVGDHTLAQSETWRANPSSRPPTWTIMLNLRAESVRSLLLKPFFFSESDPEVTKKHLRPAVELVFNVVHVLYTLNTTTDDIYRKQHPYYQHLLASASALAYLVIAFLEQNRATLLNSLAPDLADSLSRSFEMAVILTTAYAKTSKAARKLARRLSEMKGILLSLGMLNRSSSGERGVFARPGEQDPSLPGPTRVARRVSSAQPVSQAPPPEYSLPPNSWTPVTGEFEPVLPIPSEADAQSGWADALRLQWPIGDVSNMFSESIF